MKEANELVFEMGKKLRSMVDALRGQCTGIQDNYMLISVEHLSTVVRGHAKLRHLGENVAARHFLRPMLEGLIKLKAIKEDPISLYRIAMGEIKADEGWLKEIRPEAFEADNLALEFEKRRDEFHEAFAREFPSAKPTPADRNHLNMDALARRANLHIPYKVQYRLFCRHTHGNLSAMAGQFDDLETNEDKFAALLLHELMEIMEGLGAPAIDRAALMARIDGL